VRVRLNCPQPILLAGHDANVGDFFAADIVADFPAVRANAPAAAENAVFLLDTSLSANPDHFNVWVALLQNILAANEGTLRHFNLLIFNIETAWWKSGTMVENTAENRAAVANFVNGLALEGATDLGAAVAAVANAAPWLVPEGARADVFLLSDAAATWGDDDLHAIAKPFAGLPLRVMAYNTGMTGTDSRALDALARATGGAVITVVGEAQIEAAATAHRKAGFQLREISMPGAKDVVVAGRPRTVVPGSRLLVTGRIDANTLGDTAVVRVALTDLAGNEFAMDWPVAVMHDSLLAPRTYGQVAVGEMEMIPALADVARELGVELIAVGTHGRAGMRRLLLGSVAEKTVRLASSSVLVARGDAPSRGYRHVVVGTDLSPLADRALEQAVQLIAPGGHVQVVYAWQAPYLEYDLSGRVTLELRAGAEAELGAQRERLLALPRPPDVTMSVELRDGAPVLVLEELSRDAQLVVVGSHGRRGVRRFLLGSVAEATVRHARCSVLVVR
ncbi:MAG: universal stress protein, partial [Deltaproteobacteria bacterium]|nr:universal stress protein [Kofleriaceae bacterium]